MHLKVDRIDAFYGAAMALEHVTIIVGHGETVSIIGSNGAGKSTLLKAICGLKPPRSGVILLNDKEITSLSPYKIARLGMVMIPEGRQIFLPLTVRENLEMGAYADRKSFGRDGLQGRLEQVYRLFPVLKEREKQMGHTLSGGEQQMLAIGRALMSKPEMLLMDEPSLGLAPLLVALTFRTIKDLHSSGITILLVEQNAYDALQLADRGYVLGNGRVVMEAEGATLLKEKGIQDLYLGGQV